MKETLQNLFESRIKEEKESVKTLAGKSKTLSAIRITLFIIVGFGVVWFANENQPDILLTILLAGVVVFVLLMVSHSKAKFKLLLAESRLQVSEEELQRISLDINSLDQGSEFYDQFHPYHEDLDIYGKHSIFQLINRTTTLYGKQTLAKWLDAPAENEIIIKRQQTQTELKEKLDLRQNFQAFGLLFKEKTNPEALLEWLGDTQKAHAPFYLKAALAVLPLAMITTIVMSLSGLVVYQVPILIGFINAAFLLTVFKKLEEITRKTESGYKSLQVLKHHIELLENESFESEALKNIQQNLRTENSKASDFIQQLHSILDNLQNRANLMYVVFDVLLLLDVFWYIRIQNWRSKNQVNLESWFKSIGEFEALSSIAGFSHVNPDYTLPQLTDEPYQLKAETLGHPMISAQSRISNDFEFKGKGGVCLITGSNMSGKSTFLRTLGVNCILGLMGAPVCAESMTIGQMKVFTSMRSKDDLEEHVSSFYAELKRLKQLLGYIDGDKPILYMIDEVLKGTNSDDRHKGATALIKQLNSTDAFGFVSTHDIELGNITNQLKHVKNYSFNSIIEGDEIIFDYTLTDGICKSFNATKLMQNMGIDIPD